MAIYDAQTGDLIPDDQIPTAVAEGRASIDPTASLVLTDQSGQRINLSGQQAAEQLGSRLAAGWRLETGEQTQQRDLQTRAQSETLTGGAEALAQGASLGLYGAAVGQLSPELSERMLARREAMGTAGQALELAGAVAPSVLSGGAFTPAGALARLTGRAGAATEAALLARGVGSASAKIAGMGAEGLLDGAVSGLAQELSEDSLGQHEITAEKLLASGGLGALLGLGVGSGLGAASSVARRIANRNAAKAAGQVLEETEAPVLDALSKQAEDDAGLFKFVPDRALRAIENYGSTLTGTDKSVLQEAIGSKSFRGEWLNKDAAIVEHTKSVRDGINQLLDVDPVVRRIFAGDLKSANVAADVARGPGVMERALSAADPIFADIESTLERLKPDLDKASYSAYRRDVNDMRLQLSQAAAEDAPEKAFLALENYKRNFDGIVDQGPKRQGGSQLQGRLHKEKFEMARRGGDNLRSLLEDESIFGLAGAKQAEQNKAIREVIESGHQFNDLLVRRTGESASPEQWWIEQRRSDTAKTHNFVKGMNDPLRDEANAVVQRHVAAQKQLFDVLGRNGSIPDAYKAQFDSAISGVDQVDRTLTKAQDRLGKIALLDNLLKQGNENAGALDARTLATAGGFALGGVGAALGAATGGMMSIMRNPAMLVKQVAQMEAINNRITSRSNLIKSKATAAVERLALPRNERSKATLVGTRAAVSVLGKTRQEREKNANKLEMRLSNLNNPERFDRALAYQTGQLASAAPKTSLALGMQTAAAVGFLRSKLPPPAQFPNQLQPQLQKRRWTDQQLDQLSRYVATIDKPESALDDMARGQLSPEQVETLRAVYPNMLEEAKQSALEHLSSRKTEIPYHGAVQLSLLLGLEGHPTMSKQFLQTSQQLWAKPPEEKQAPPPATETLEMSNAQGTEVDKLMGGLSK